MPVGKLSSEGDTDLVRMYVCFLQTDLRTSRCQRHCSNAMRKWFGREGCL